MNEHIEDQNEDDGAGLPIVRLDELGENTIIDEANLAKLFGKCRKSIKRSVTRGELPPPMRFFGKRTWLSGQLSAHIRERLAAIKDKAQLVRK
jgi:predicted DNA-binding transcriptional regulator AlpA